MGYSYRNRGMMIPSLASMTGKAGGTIRTRSLPLPVLTRLLTPGPRPLTRPGLAGLSDFDWPAAVVGIYQAYTASVNQGRADDVYVDYLRDQVHRAIYAIRQRIKQGDVSPTVALQAGQEVISAFYRETGAMPRAQARQRAENYRSVFEANAALNGSEAAFYYGRYNCPESTHTTATGILEADLPNCIALSGSTTPTTGGPGVPTGNNPQGGTAPPGTPGAVAGGSVGGIFDALGSLNLLGFQVPILPVAVIALILLTRK